MGEPERASEPERVEPGKRDERFEEAVLPIAYARARELCVAVDGGDEFDRDGKGSEGLARELRAHDHPELALPVCGVERRARKAQMRVG
jgi:hypothetical protein